MVVFGRTWNALLFDVSPTDARLLAAAALTGLAVAAAACTLPARRAARIDPATALKGE